MRKLGFLGVVAGLLSATSVSANNVAWTGDAGMPFEWTTAGNWNPMDVPGEVPFDNPTDCAVLTNNPQNIIVPAAAPFLTFGGIQVNTRGFTVTNNSPNAFNLNGDGITGSQSLAIVNQGMGILDFGGNANAGSSTITNTAAGGGAGLYFAENSQANLATINTNGNFFIGSVGGGGGRTAPLQVGALSGAGTVEIEVSGGAGNDQLIIGGLNQLSTFSGTITDGVAPLSVIVGQSGNDRFAVLPGVLFDYTGPTTVAGTMIMDGDYTGGTLWTITCDGTMQGSGSVDDDLFNCGTFSPGSPSDLFGNFGVGATYSTDFGSVTSFKVQGPVSSTMTIGGDANLNGGAIGVELFEARYNTGFTNTLMTVAGATNGAFTRVVGLTPRVGVVNLNALLTGGQFTAVEIPFSQMLDIYFGGGTGNQASLAGALDAGANDPNISADFNNVIGVFNVIPNVQQFGQAMRAVGSTAFTASPRANYHALNLVSSTVQNPGVKGTDLPINSSFTTKFSAPKTYAFLEEASAFSGSFQNKAAALKKTYLHQSPRKHTGFERTALSLKEHVGAASREEARNVAAHDPGKGQLWFQGFAGKTHVDDTRKDLGFDAVMTGAMMGMDYALDDCTRFGVGGGYGKTRVDFEHQLGKSDNKGPFVSVWGSKYFDDVDLDAGVTVQNIHYTTERHIRILTQINRTARASYNGYAVMPHFAAAYNVDGGCDYHIRPFVAFDGFIDHENKFTEKGATSLNLSVKARKTALLQSSIGLGIDKHMRLECGVLRPEFQFSYRNRAHLFGDEVKSNFVNQAAVFTSTRTHEMQHRMGVGFELGYIWNEGGTVKIGYRGDYGKNEHAHMGFISAGKSW